MATTREISNGDQIAAPATEIEVRQAKNVPNGTRMGFLVTSGAMQVTVAPYGTQDAIDASVASFGNTNYPVYMTVEPGGKTDQAGANIFIKGGGTIVFFW